MLVAALTVPEDRAQLITSAAAGSRRRAAFETRCTQANSVPRDRLVGSDLNEC